MAEKINDKSMLDLALKKSPVSRRDAEGLDASGKPDGDKKFNGFLQAFLGKDKSRGSKASSGKITRFADNSIMEAKPRSKGGRARADRDFAGQKIGGGFDGQNQWSDAGKNRSQIAKAAEKMNLREQSALRRALAKTIRDDEAFEAGLVDPSLAGYGDSLVNINENLDNAPAGTGVPVDPEIAKVAEEAAKLIWGLLFPSGAAGQGSTEEDGMPSAFNGLAEVANYINAMAGQTDSDGGSLSGLGTAGVDSGEMAAAIETTNVSAEMNIEAVLSALEDLLDGMPRHALEAALSKTAGVSGGSGAADSLEQLAAALGLDSVEFSSESPIEGWDLLASLKNSHYNQAETVDVAEAMDTGETAKPAAGVETAEPTGPAETMEADEVAAADGMDAAEIAGETDGQQDIIGWLRKFLEENIHANSSGQPINMVTASANDTAPAIPDALLDLFSKLGIAFDDNMLSGEGVTPEKVLASIKAVLGSGGGQLSVQDMQIFTNLKENLERVLHSLADDLKVMTEKVAITTNPDSPKGMADPTKTTGSPDRADRLSVLVAGDETVAKNPGESNVAGREVGQVSGVPANQGGTAMAKQAAGTMANPMFDQIANIERLTELVRLANRRGAQNLTMQLSPPELGKVTVSVASKNGVLSAVFKVEQADAAAQLQNGMHQLKESLKAQGIELSQVEVRHQEGYAAGGDGSGHNRDSNATQHAGSPARRGMANVGADEGKDALEEHEGGTNANGILNLFA